VANLCQTHSLFYLVQQTELSLGMHLINFWEAIKKHKKRFIKFTLNLLLLVVTWLTVVVCCLLLLTFTSEFRSFLVTASYSW